jgi:hypothetical protein
LILRRSGHIKYSLEIEFDADISEAQAKDWLAGIIDGIPIEASPHGRIWSPPEVLSVAELNSEHVGKYLYVNRGTNLRRAEGKIEAVYASAHGTERKVVVLGGLAHELQPYEVVTIKNRSDD